MGCLFTASLWPAAATSASTQRGWQLRLPDGRTLFVRDRQGCSQPLRSLGLMFLPLYVDGDRALPGGKSKGSQEVETSEGASSLQWPE